VKPETAEFIAYAIKLLGDADKMLDTGLDDHAARTAYLACFHMARAYTFERNGRTCPATIILSGRSSSLSRYTYRQNPRRRANGVFPIVEG
jgi:hypothetical protein